MKNEFHLHSVHRALYLVYLTGVALVGLLVIILILIIKFIIKY